MNSAQSSGAAILLVDDLPENLLALEAILAGLGHELVRAGSGPEALKELLRRDIALILLDVQMPGMDGFETAAHIKRRERTRDIPIIFLTAINHGPHHTFRGYAAGAVDYISKPFDPWVLRAKVSVFVDLYMKNCQLREQAALLRLRTVHRIAVLHYSPILATVEGEPREIFPFLGCSRLEEPLNRYRVDACVHGHAHNGALEGKTATLDVTLDVVSPQVSSVCAAGAVERLAHCDLRSSGSASRRPGSAW